MQQPKLTCVSFVMLVPGVTDTTDMIFHYMQT